MEWNGQRHPIFLPDYNAASLYLPLLLSYANAMTMTTRLLEENIKSVSVNALKHVIVNIN